MQKSKTRNLVALSLAVFLAVSMLVSTMNVAKADTTTVVYLDPAVVDLSTNPGLAIGSTFVVTAKIADVTDLWGYSVKVTFNNAVIEVAEQEVDGEMVPMVTMGTFFPTSAQWIPTAYNPEGYAIGNCLFLTAGGNRDGSGDLMYITFKVVGYGSTDIAIAQSELALPGEEPHGAIPHTAIGATFNLPPPPASGPQAKFTPVAGTFYLQYEMVNLDASSSVPGYDTLGVAEICPITTYAWSIDYLNDGSVDASFSGATASYNATIVGEHKITLTVTAPDPTAPTHPDYTTTSTITKIINIRAQPQGADIDVYTNRGGNGPNAPADAYGPQELVEIYAYVTYNNVPVVNKNVAFEIFNSEGASIAYRTASTNDSGIATVEYRLPWPDTTQPEIIFGTNWTIAATVDVSQVIKSDNVSFEFNYIIKIDSIATLTQSNQAAVSFARESLVKINVTLSNIRSVDVIATVTMVIYDENQVPVGVYVADLTVDAEDSTSIAGSIPIPSYAFVGQAVVYVNSLTQIPSQGGVPYCPEESVEFAITV